MLLRVTLFYFIIIMIILQETAASQTLRIIPREYAITTTYNVNITSDSENKNIYSAAYTNQFTVDRYWYNVPASIPNLEQDNFYTLIITDAATKEVFRGRIFCTNQTLSDYSVNQGEYTTTTSTNEFLFYEA